MRLFINIDVDDLERAIAFYTAGLGLRMARRLFDGSVAEMVGASSTVYLIAKPAGTQASPNAEAQRVYARHWTPVHLDFCVADLSSAVRRATDAGATLEGPIQSFSWGDQATLSDPFGHGFCLLHFWRGDYDAVVHRDAQQ